MKYAPKQRKYIASIDGDAHLSAVLIIGELEAENKKLRVNAAKDMVIIGDLQAENKRYREALEKISISICEDKKSVAQNALKESEK